MAVDKEQGQPARFGQAVLDLRPGERRVFAVFLRIQDNGGLSWHLYRGILLDLGFAAPLPSRGPRGTLASIDFKCVTYKDLGAESRELSSHHPHMRGHLRAKCLIAGVFLAWGPPTYQTFREEDRIE